MAIKHTFVSEIPDEGVTGVVSPTHWNANHTVEDGSIDVAALATSVQQSFIPGGGIIMWSGSIASIPQGWFLCDGNNGTPDLRNRFIVGADVDDGGVSTTSVVGGHTKSGGSATHTHNEHGRHIHSLSLTSGSGGAHDHAISGSTGTGSGGTHFNTDGSGQNGQTLLHTHTAGTLAADQSSTHTHSVSGDVTLNTSGTSATQHSTSSNLGPYYALAFIMRAQSD